MITHVSPRARVGLAAFALATIALFTILLARFGGPQLGGGRAVYARFADAQGLTPNADVLVRGVRVGRVAAITAGGARSRVKLELDANAPALHRDAVATVGSKTPLGESFVVLDPGTGSPSLGGAPRTIATRPTVQIDDALSVLDRAGREDLRRVLASSARALRSPAASQQVSDTLAALDQATVALKGLAGTLQGQDGQIATTVTNARSVLHELGDHDSAVRSIVHDGRTTLAALAAARAAIGPSLQRARTVVRKANTTLGAARPLIAEAQPFVAAVDDAAPHLSSALRTLPATMTAANGLIAKLPAVQRAASPTLRTARHHLPAIDRAVRALGPALQNIVPMLGYLAPRANTIAAWFSNTAALGQNGDAKGRWARFFVGFDPSSGFGLPGSPPGNSYPQPDDAAHNGAYRPGDFPHLMPFRPDSG